jgi:hypothetical protein
MRLALNVHSRRSFLYLLFLLSLHLSLHYIFISPGLRAEEEYWTLHLDFPDRRYHVTNSIHTLTYMFCFPQSYRYID